MPTHYFPGAERGIKDQGWLKSQFTFSFSDYCQPMKSAFGTLITFNDDYVIPGKGFGIHPHVNMEIISILLSGKMNHKDSMGYSTVIEEGGVQIMSAGSGLKHEEYNIGEEDVNFLQIWIQPKLQNIPPRYQLRHFPKATRRNKLTTIISGEEGLNHCWINQNAKIKMGAFDAGNTFSYSLPVSNMCAFLFVISGSVLVNGISVKTRDAIGIWETAELAISCPEVAEFVLIETPVNQK